MCNNGCTNKLIIIDWKTFTDGIIIAKSKRALFNIYISIATDVVAIDKSNGFIPTNIVTFGISLCL